MTIEEIERLLRRLARTDITEFEIADETASLRLRLAPGPGAPEPPAVEAPDPPVLPRVLTAKAIGRLRLRHPEAAPKADETDPRAVVAGDIVAFLEAGPCLRPVVAEHDGLIGPPLQPDGSLIGYGTPLFRLL